MTEDTARTILLIGAGVVWLLWLVAVRVWSRMKPRPARPEDDMFRIEEAESEAPELAADSVEVDLEPETISSKLAGLLTSLSMAARGPMTAVAIKDRTADELVFQAKSQLGNPNKPTASAGITIDGRFRFERLGPTRTRVAFEVDMTPLMRKIKKVVWVLLFPIGIPVLIGLPVVLWFWAVPSESIGIRGQCVQVFQAVHVVWPTFLITFLGRRIVAKVCEMLRTMIANLQHT